MRFSIITVCRNSESTIAQCIESVLSQTNVDIEYILIDGNSTDATVSVINEYQQHISTLVSEPDNGIYDAMNKGLSIATGDVIGFLNADDFYTSNSALLKIQNEFEKNDIDACYGDLCYVSQNDTDNVIRYWKSNEFKKGLFSKGWNPPHPTFYVKKEIYDRHGYFDLSYSIASDIDLMMRFLEKYEIRTNYIPETLVHMRLGGETNKSISNIIKQNRQILQSFNNNQVQYSLLQYIVGKVSSRAGQYLSRPEHR